MSSLIFKFKQPVTFAYAPGMAISGVDGDPGEQGEAGKSMYFIDYEPDNDYYKELALQRIEQNYILSKDSNVSINERPYKNGDIFITSSMSCYSLGEPEENSTYKFSLNYIGKFHSNLNNMSSNIKYLEIYDVTGSAYYTQESVLSEKHWIKSYDSSTLSPVNINRDNSKYINGMWLKFVLNVENKDASIDYMLEIYPDSKKSYTYNSYDDTPFNNISTFYKPLSYKLTPFTSTLESKDFYNYMFSDIIGTNLSTEKYVAPGATTTFISDYSFDRMDSEYNNIKCVSNGTRYIVDASSGETQDVSVGTPINNYVKYHNSFDGSINLRSGDAASYSSIQSSQVHDALRDKLLKNNHIKLICRNRDTNEIEILDENDINVQYHKNVYYNKTAKVSISPDNIIESFVFDNI